MIKQLAEEAKASGEDSDRTRYARPSKPSTQDVQEQIEVKLETIFLNQIKALSAEEPPDDEDSWSTDESLEDFEKYLAADNKRKGTQLLSEALSKVDADEDEKRAMQDFFRFTSTQLRPMPTQERSSYVGTSYPFYV